MRVLTDYEVVTHEHVGQLVDTVAGPMFACRRCQRDLTAEEWALPCKGVAREVLRAAAALAAILPWALLAYMVA